MKSLLIIRHAKSSRDPSGIGDYERTLEERGVRDAHAIGKYLRENSIRPDYLLSSPAVRAKQTAAIIAEEIGYSLDKIQAEKLLYEQSTSKIIAYLQNLQDCYSMVMIVGHNPSALELVNALGNQPFSQIPSCGVVCLDFQVENWTEIDHGKGQVRFFISPDMLRENR